MRERIISISRTLSAFVWEFQKFIITIGIFLRNIIVFFPPPSSSTTTAAVLVLFTISIRLCHFLHPSIFQHITDDFTVFGYSLCNDFFCVLNNYYLVIHYFQLPGLESGTHLFDTPSIQRPSDNHYLFAKDKPFLQGNVTLWDPSEGSSYRC